MFSLIFFNFSLKCKIDPNAEGSEIFDNLENLEPSLSVEIKMALVYIAGYIAKMIISSVNMKPIFIMKSMENIPIQLTVENYWFLLTTLAYGKFFVSSFSIQ